MSPTSKKSETLKMVKTVRKLVKTDYSAEKSPILHIRWVKINIFHFELLTQPKLSKK